MTDIRTRHLKKTRKRTDGPGSIKKITDGNGLHLGIPWPSLHLTNQASVNSRIWKWMNILQGYDLEMIHIPGKKNPAGSLSRQHFDDACAQRREVKEEEEDMVRVLRVKPHATNKEIQDALSKIFSGRDTESEPSSSSDQFKSKSKKSRYLIQSESETDTKRQSDGLEPTA